MSDTATGANESNQDGNLSSESTSGAGDDFKAITTQEDLNKIIAERVNRERGKYADYKDLKAKAAEYDKVAEASKSDLEKANERAAQAERERDAALSKALRSGKAAEYGISAEDAELFLTGTDEETLDRQAKRLAGREADRKKSSSNVVPREGNSPQSAEDESRAVTRELFGP